MVSTNTKMSKKRRTFPGQGNAIRIGWTLFVFGILLLVFPLIGHFWLPALIDGANETSQWVATSLPVCLFFSALFLSFGLTMLFTQAVDYSAIGEGTAKVFGMELPIKVQGGAIILFVLLVGIFFGMERFGLTGIAEDWSKISSLEAQVQERDGQIENLKLEREKLKGNLVGIETTSQHMADALIAHTESEAHRMMVRLKCRRGGPERTVRWEDFDGATEKRGFMLAAENYRQETSTELPSEAHLLTNSQRITYTIATFDPERREAKEVISARFQFEDDILVATVWPNTSSLIDVCRSQNEAGPSEEGQIQDASETWQQVEGWQELADQKIDR